VLDGGEWSTLYTQQELLCQFEEDGLAPEQVWKGFGEEKSITLTRL